MKKLMFIFACFLLTNQDMLAGTRSEQQMKQAAIQVLNKAKARGATSAQLKERLAMSKLRIYGYDDGGFAVVTSDDRFESVIGYSTSSYTDSIPCGLKWWLETVDTNMRSLEAPTYKRAGTRASSSGAGPLLTTNWGQERPFNDNCTFTNGGYKYQCVTGCVATAMAQVMNYYKYPKHGTGYNSYDIDYNNSFTVTFSEDFSQSVYDWDNMLDNYKSYYYNTVKDSHTNAVAKLMKDCGVSVNTKYSSANVGSGSSLQRAENALKTYFFYDQATKYYDRYYYQKTDWMNLVYGALDAGRPIIYGGQVGESILSEGHAFVLHGYDSTGKVLVNWGWNGAYDGYYDIDLLNPDDSNYKYWQDMVIAITGYAPTPQIYTLKLTSQGAGCVYYGSIDGTKVREGSLSFKVTEGNNAVLVLSPDAGSKVKSVKVNNNDVTWAVVNNKYTLTNVQSNAEVVVEFETSSDATSDGDYNKFITCYNKTIQSITIFSYTEKSVTFEIMNSGNETIYITKLIAKDPSTNEILFSLTDNGSLGEFVGGSTKTLNQSIYKGVGPIYEMEYTRGNQKYVYDMSKYKMLTLSSNQYGQLVFSGIKVGVEARRFSIEQGSDVTIDIIPLTKEGLTSLTLNSDDVTSSVKNNRYTIQNFKSDKVLKAAFDSDNTIGGHEFVDLGLSSGKCWSVVNYGAEKPEEYGNYQSDADNFNKKWGDNWKVPSKEEVQELIDECEWTWTAQNGVNGYRIKGPNNNTMFLPAAGEDDRFFGSSRVGQDMYYFTSSKDDFYSNWVLYGNSTKFQLRTASMILDKEYPIRPIATIIKKNGVAGDVNGDGELNKKDVKAIEDYIMGKSTNNFDWNAADVNHDGKVNAADIVAIIKSIR